MGSIKLVMMGVSTILIPLGKLIFKKIVKKGVDKLDSRSGDDEEDKLVSSTQKVMSKAL
jgi:hypothetical protein